MIPIRNQAATAIRATAMILIISLLKMIIQAAEIPIRLILRHRLHLTTRVIPTSLLLLRETIPRLLPELPERLI